MTTKEQAKAVLNCQSNDSEDFVDALEEEIHQLKQPFLNRFIPPKLVEAKSRKLDQLILAKKALNIESSPLEEVQFEPSKKSDKTKSEFMQWHLSNLYRLKKYIANNYNPETLKVLIENYLKLQLDYKEFWKGSFSEVPVELQVEPDYDKFIENNFTEELVNYERVRVSKF